MSTGERIRTEKRNGIGIISLNRPETLNILDSVTLKELGNVLGHIGDDEEVRAVIITGEKHFCAGADIREVREKSPEEAETFAKLGHSVFNAIEKMPKPVIAAILGYALGGGCELALACDLRIAGENAKLGQPEINLGIIPGFGATQRLSRLVGIGKAKEMVLTGKVIDAREAGAIGLVNQVVKDEEVMSTSEGLARLLAQKSPIALKLAKKLINENQETGKALESEIASFSECFATEDYIEGINAFLEKRAPKFKGK
jgi:enoyl-CoA hydratase